MTPLDAAFAAAEAEDAPERARRRAYALLLETELCLPVRARAEAAGPPEPEVFPLSEGPVALAFDGDARMAAFFEGPTEYVALPGRALIGLLAEARLGLAVNLGGAGGAVLPAAAVAWIATEMAAAPATDALSGALALGPPAGAPAALLEALAARLAALPGFVAEAWLARLGPPGARGELTLALLPSPAARRAAEGLAAALAALAEAHAPEGETVAVGVLHEGHPLLGPARSRGIGLHPGPRPAPDAPAAPTPPRLR